MAISTKKGDFKKYSVGGGPLSRFAFADTLEEAKRAGMAIAKKEAWRGKWNISYYQLRVYQSSSPGYYKPTKWLLIIPLRGTGRKADDIEAEIKKRFKTDPLKWVRR